MSPDLPVPVSKQGALCLFAKNTRIGGYFDNFLPLDDVARTRIGTDSGGTTFVDLETMDRPEKRKPLERFVFPGGRGSVAAPFRGFAMPPLETPVC